MKYLFSLSITISLLCVACAPQNEKQDESSKEQGAEIAKTAPEWTKNINLYEVNIRQYSEDGTFKAIENDLQRIKDLGVDVLWFMPIHPIGEKNRKGTQGSYYSVKDYKAVHPDYGSLQDFKSLVNKIHEMGMYVIIDWVANHSAFDNVWVSEANMEWYTLDSSGKLQPPLNTDWWDVADLNYDNKDMRAAMIEALKFWVEECDIDGYRCDVADWVPVDFWNEARASLDAVKPVFMLAEAETPELHEKAFDMTYGWEFHFIMNEIAQGKKNVNDIRTYLNGNAKRFKKEDYRLHFTSNHDENTWKGTVKERMGDALKAFAVLSATMEGAPLIYNGQEGGLDKRLEFFEKDPIEWTDDSLTPFYQKLLELNHENQALYNGIYGGDLEILSPDSDSIGFAFSRSKGEDEVIAIFNFSDNSHTITLNKEISDNMKELFDEAIPLKGQNKIELSPWGYRVFYK